MKKLLSVLVAFVLLLSLAACESAPTDQAETEYDPDEIAQASPEATPEPTPEAAPEPTLVPLKSRQDLLNIGFERFGETDIYIGKMSELFTEPLIADNALVEHQGIVIDYISQRILVLDAYNIPEEYIEEGYGWGYDDDGNVTLFGEGERNGQIVKLVANLYLNEEKLGVDSAALCFDADQLETITVNYSSRDWLVFQLDRGEDIGFGWVDKTNYLKNSNNTLIDGFALLTYFELPEQDKKTGDYRVCVSPHELRTKYGLAGLQEGIEQEIVNEAKAQYEAARKKIEEKLGLAVTDLLQLS